MLLGVAAALVGATGAAAGFESATYRDIATDRELARADVPDHSDRHSIRILWRARTTEPVLALTFDDGPTERFTRPLLDVLEEARVPATFAITGKRALAQRQEIKREASGRHELMNHMWSHGDVSQLSAGQIGRELDRTDELLRSLGVTTAFTRPPYGRLTGAFITAAADRGKAIAMWDDRFYERDYGSARNAERLAARFRPGMIILGHDGGSGPHDVGISALPLLIAAARKAGYRFVTLSEMLALDTG